ncbi:hypothetical protein [Staphylococcus cohnii]|uniref:hypothetical protein n=1 Tax=Staphylococcus cohnii TaxID=29382 RepID=UPI003D7C6D26
MKKEELTFKENWLEGKYKESLSKEEKKAYKRLSIPEKKKVLAEFKAERDKVKAEKQAKIDKTWEEGKQKRAEKREANKGKPFYKRHKKSVIAVIVILFLGVCGMFIDDSEDVNTEETKQTETEQTEAKPEKKEEPKKAEKQEAKKEPSKKPLTDEQKLNKALKKEVTSADIKDVEFGTGVSDVTISLDGKSNLSDKMTSRNFRMGTVEALYALKKSGIDVNSADIYVYFDLNDGMKDEEAMVMSSRWDKATIDEMNEDAKYTLPDAIESHAESSFIHPVMRKSEK